MIVRMYAHSLGIVAQIKIMKESSLILLGQWFGFIQAPFRKYKIMLWKKKELKTSKLCSVFFNFIL
jgi:hypothetical protein